MNNLGGVFASLLGLTGLLGFAGAVVNGKRKDGYNAILKSSNEELRLSIQDKDKRITELEAELKVAEAARDTAETLRQAAVSMATSRPEFDRLGTQMVKQHKELLSAVGDITKSMGEQVVALNNLATTIAKGQV